jgi:hypothetical protein
MIELTNTLTPGQIYLGVVSAIGDCHTSVFSEFDTGEVLEDGKGRGTKQPRIQTKG